MGGHRAAGALSTPLTAASRQSLRDVAARLRAALFQHVRGLRDAGYGAALVAASERAAHPDRTDRLVLVFDGNAAGERDYVPKLALRREWRVAARSLRPVRRVGGEGARRVGFASGKLDIVWVRLVALKEDAQPADAIDH